MVVGNAEGTIAELCDDDQCDARIVVKHRGVPSHGQLDAALAPVQQQQ
jgi:hypothetical protein